MSKRGIVTRGQAFGPSGAWARRRRNNAKAPNRGGFLVRNFIDLGEYSVPPQKGAAYETASAQIFASWFWPGAISLSVGNYSVAGEQEALKKTSVGNAQSVSYSLTGENETLKAGRKLSVQETPYTLTGEQIVALKASVGKLQTGTYTTTSQPTLKKTSLQSIQEVPYTLTVEAETLKKSSKVFPQAGFYALTGENAALKRAAIVFAQMTPFALTGESITFTIPVSAFSMSLGAGTYSLTLENEKLKRTAATFPQTGFYFFINKQVAQIAPSIAASVQSAFLLGMGPFAGNAFAQGPVIALPPGFTINLGTGFYSLSGEALSLAYKRRAVLNAGSYALAGESLKGLATRRLSLLSGSYAHLGNNVKLAIGTPVIFTVVMSPILLGISATPKLEGEA